MEDRSPGGWSAWPPLAVRHRLPRAVGGVVDVFDWSRSSCRPVGIWTQLVKLDIGRRGRRRLRARTRWSASRSGRGGAMAASAPASSCCRARSRCRDRQRVPIIALVPIFNNMFASTSETPRRLMVTLMRSSWSSSTRCAGLRDVDRRHRELLRSYAVRRHVLVVRIPNALPYLFTALRIAPLAVITASWPSTSAARRTGWGADHRAAVEFETAAPGRTCRALPARSGVLPDPLGHGDLDQPAQGRKAPV